MVIKTTIKQYYSILTLACGNKIKVDTDDLPLLKGKSWHINRYGYAVAGKWNKKRKQNKLIYMHRLIINAIKGLDVDHINGEPLDNRKKNLRLASKQQNGQNRLKLSRVNTSGTTGVYFDKKRKKWIAMIKIYHKSIYLGGFENIKDAIATRNDAEHKYFKDFAPKQALCVKG